MPGIILPIPLVDGAPLPFFDMQAQLESVTYTLQFRWNVRASAWYLDVYDESATTVLLAGLKLVADWPLAAYTTQRQPPGALVVIDSSGNGTDPTLTSFGIQHGLFYFSAAELGL